MTSHDAYKKLLQISAVGVQALRVDTTYKSLGLDSPPEVATALAQARADMNHLRMQLEVERARRRFTARYPQG